MRRMDEPTRRALLDLSRDFYQDEGASFDATRQKPWAGWHRLVSLWRGRTSLRVLDAGCGNGRFAHFLAASLDCPIDYLGLDSSGPLLASGRALVGTLLAPSTTKPSSKSRFCFEEAEIQDWLGRGHKAGFDLVVLFGVLHHIPSRRHRRLLLEACGRLLRTGGHLVPTWWMLHRSTRFQKKLTPWSDRPEIDESLLEDGDFLLRWQGRSATPRYCHFPTEQELGQLRRLPDLEVLEEFLNDGPGGEDNLYRVYRKRCNLDT